MYLRGREADLRVVELLLHGVEMVGHDLDAAGLLFDLSLRAEHLALALFDLRYKRRGHDEGSCVCVRVCVCVCVCSSPLFIRRGIGAFAGAKLVLGLALELVLRLGHLGWAEGGAKTCVPAGHVIC